MKDLEFLSDRPKAMLARTLMLQAGMTYGDAAKIIGCRESSLRNKLSRGALFIDELLKLSYASKYSLRLVPTDSAQSTIIIDAKSWFKNDPDALLEAEAFINNKRDALEKEAVELSRRFRMLGLNLEFFIENKSGKENSNGHVDVVS